jgi:hypothetical protein
VLYRGQTREQISHPLHLPAISGFPASYRKQFSGHATTQAAQPVHFPESTMSAKVSLKLWPELSGIAFFLG